MNKIFPGLFILISLQCISQETKRYYSNPVLAGFYPDPGICRVNNNYYMVNSSFSYFPGVPLFHSTDLVHWRQIGHVLDRPSQLNITDLGVSEGIFAPAISYHNGVFYMVTTLAGGGGNFVVTTHDIQGSWSDPVFLPQVNGIDPSLFFDDNGKAYIVHNGEAPDSKPLYEGHRALWILEFDPQTLKTISDPMLLVNGGTDISKKPIWIEGPHIFKKDNLYYLIAAEGGTSYDHSEVVFRSKEVLGPYESYSNNPILTQRYLDPSRPFPITNSGHADFVCTQNNDWWAVFLACRPYIDNYFNTGRETFMAPVKWSDGWPEITGSSEIISYTYPAPDLLENDISDFPKNGNFTLKDDFNTSFLQNYWVFLRTPAEPWYTISDGTLQMKLRPVAVEEKKSASMILRRQQHTVCDAIVSMSFSARDSNEIAGLIIFQNEKYFFLLGKTKRQDKDCIILKQGAPGGQGTSYIIASILLDDAWKGDQIYLKIQVKNGLCNFFYGYEPDSWLELYSHADATYLSTEKAGGFTGAMFGMYASSYPEESSNIAVFDWFLYKGCDLVFDAAKTCINEQ